MVGRRKKRTVKAPATSSRNFIHAIDTIQTYARVYEYIGPHHTEIFHRIMAMDNGKVQVSWFSIGALLYYIQSQKLYSPQYATFNDCVSVLFNDYITERKAKDYVDTYSALFVCGIGWENVKHIHETSVRLVCPLLTPKNALSLLASIADKAVLDVRYCVNKIRNETLDKKLGVSFYTPERIEVVEQLLTTKGALTTVFFKLSKSELHKFQQALEKARIIEGIYELRDNRTEKFMVIVNAFLSDKNIESLAHRLAQYPPQRILETFCEVYPDINVTVEHPLL